MKEEIKKIILDTANSQIAKLTKEFLVSYNTIKVEIDEESTNGNGYFDSKMPDTIFFVFKSYTEKTNVIQQAKKTTTHEFCHLYVKDKGFLEHGRFNKDIEKKILSLIEKYKIVLDKKENGKYNFRKLISKYADDNSNYNTWHEVLCEAFSRYFCYDYNKNEELLIEQAHIFHKELVDFLLNYKINNDACCFNELDIDYFL